MYGTPITLKMDYYFEETVFKLTQNGMERPTTSELEEAVKFLSREVRERKEAAAKGEARNGGSTLDD